MLDWSKGKIYKVTCAETGNVYIGSTVQSLKKRFSAHNDTYNQCETRDFINPKIELLEDYPCETRGELLWKEREWMEKTVCVNKQRPIATLEEHIEKHHEYNRVKFNCECGGKFTRQNKARHLKCKKHINFILNTRLV